MNYKTLLSKSGRSTNEQREICGRFNRPRNWTFDLLLHRRASGDNMRYPRPFDYFLATVLHQHR